MYEQTDQLDTTKKVGTCQPPKIQKSQKGFNILPFYHEAKKLHTTK